MGRNTERFKEVEKGQAQIALAVSRASGTKGEKNGEQEGEILLFTRKSATNSLGPDVLSF